MSGRIPERWKTVLQLGFVLALIGVMAVLMFYLLSVKSVGTPNRSVHFQVEASGGYAIITLQAGNVSISKPATVSTPWKQTILVPRGATVYLTASNPTQTGNLTCSISYDNLAWQQENTSAPKDGVACAGIVP